MATSFQLRLCDLGPRNLIGFEGRTNGQPIGPDRTNYDLIQFGQVDRIQHDLRAAKHLAVGAMSPHEINKPASDALLDGGTARSSITKLEVNIKRSLPSLLKQAPFTDILPNLNPQPNFSVITEVGGGQTGDQNMQAGHVVKYDPVIPVGSIQWPVQLIEENF